MEGIIMSQSAPLKIAFTKAEAALYLSVSRSFLRKARMDGDRENHAPGPPYVKIGRMIRYRKADLDAWLEQPPLAPGKT